MYITSFKKSAVGKMVSKDTFNTGLPLTFNLLKRKQQYLQSAIEQGMPINKQV